MNSAANPPPPLTDSELTNPAMHQAVRARALHQIEQEQSRPPMPLKRRLLLLALTAVAVTVVVLLLNWIVTGLFRIMDIWYPGSITERYREATQHSASAPASDPSQPFMITVVPDTAPEQPTANEPPSQQTTVGESSRH